MLFDLKGRRKRFIQVTYVALAFLFAVGLIGFGIGGGVSGGFFDAISGGGGGGGSNVFKDRAAQAQRAVRLHPHNERAWLRLAQAKFDFAQSGDDYDRTSGQFSEGATGDLGEATRAWEQYLALKPRKPDPNVAFRMFQAYATLLQFSPTSVLETARKAAHAEEIVNKARPSPNGSFILARIYYFLGELRKGDAAARETLRKVPKDQRNTVKAQLDEGRKQAAKARKATRAQTRQAERQAREQIKKGQDPFGAQPGQSPLGP